MKLPSSKLSHKVRNSGLAGLLTTLLLVLATNSPMKNNAWIRLLAIPEFTSSLVGLVMVGAGYATDEKAY